MGLHFTAFPSEAFGNSPHAHVFCYEHCPPSSPQLPPRGPPAKVTCSSTLAFLSRPSEKNYISHLWDLNMYLYDKSAHETHWKIRHFEYCMDCWYLDIAKKDHCTNFPVIKTWKEIIIVKNLRLKYWPLRKPEEMRDLRKLKLCWYLFTQHKQFI